MYPTHLLLAKPHSSLEKNRGKLLLEKSWGEIRITPEIIIAYVQTSWHFALKQSGNNYCTVFKLETNSTSKTVAMPWV